MSDHTPGPWGYEKYCGTVRVFYDIGRGTRPICKLIGEDEEANAHLIAAAPELLEALQSLTLYVEQLETVVYAPDDAGTHESVENARAAIAKAKGH
jgi:hypothetical protein